MLGLPDMTKYHSNSIAVSQTDPYTVYLGVSQSVGAGAGGVYRSTDGGKSWSWMGQGLPERQPFFTHDIWSIGREIADGADGGLVCISRDSQSVYRWDRAAERWVAAADYRGG